MRESLCLSHGHVGFTIGAHKNPSVENGGRKGRACARSNGTRRLTVDRLSTITEKRERNKIKKYSITMMSGGHRSIALTVYKPSKIMKRYLSILCISTHLVASSGFQASSRLHDIVSRPQAIWGESRKLTPLRRILDATTTPRTSSITEKVPTSRRTTQLQSNIQENSISSNNNKLDVDAVFKYAVAIAVQVGLFATVFTGLDKLVSHFAIQKIPFAINFFLFYFLALRSRVLNPLANNRPNVKNLEAQNKPKRNMPSFTPPGVVFPIVWLLIIGPIRAAASSMIYNQLGTYANLPILALMLHLSIGDVWNTINNVEQRYGTSVTGVLCVWLSKAHAAYRYYQVVPLAGKLLGATLVWLTIATTLIVATWRLNPTRVDDGSLSPLYPAKGEAQTRFAWFNKQ